MVPYHAFIVLVPEIGAVTTIDKMNTILAQRHGKDSSTERSTVRSSPVTMTKFLAQPSDLPKKFKKALVSLFLKTSSFKYSNRKLLILRQLHQRRHLVGIRNWQKCRTQRKVLAKLLNYNGHYRCLT